MIGREADTIMARWTAIALVAALSAALWSGPAAGEPLAAGDTAAVRTVASGRVNVRATPDVRPDNVIAKASSGTVVEVLEARPRGRFTWYKVRATDGRFRGWIRGDLLRPAALPSAPERVEREADAPDEPPRPPWLAALVRFYPAVDSCLDATTRRPAAVLSVRALPLGMAEVVVRDASGRIWDCSANAQGGPPLRYDPVPPARTLLGGAGKITFWRRGETPAADDPCLVRQPVPDPRGDAPLGMLLYDNCPNGAATSSTRTQPPRWRAS